MSKVFQVGLVGCGFMGRMHAAVYAALPTAELVAACDLDPANASALSGAPLAWSFDDLLADPGVEAIDICLPTYLHAEYAVKALEAGKHVVCEKPMALSLEDADRMIEAAKAADRTLMIAHCIRFWPEYVELMRIHKTGELGHLQSLNLTRYGAFPSWCWTGWLGREELSGGAALDMHIHDTDFALAMLGHPTKVRSAGTQDHRGVSHIFTTMEFGSTIVHLEGGWNLPTGAPFKMSFRAVFERGLVNFDGGPMTVYEEGKDPAQPALTTMSAQGVGGNISDMGGYYFELEYFYDQLAMGSKVEKATPETAKASLAMALHEIGLVKA